MVGRRYVLAEYGAAGDANADRKGGESVGLWDDAGIDNGVGGFPPCLRPTFAVFPAKRVMPGSGGSLGVVVTPWWTTGVVPRCEGASICSTCGAVRVASCHVCSGGDSAPAVYDVVQEARQRLTWAFILDISRGAREFTEEAVKTIRTVLPTVQLDVDILLILISEGMVVYDFGGDRRWCLPEPLGLNEDVDFGVKAAPLGDCLDRVLDVLSGLEFSGEGHCLGSALRVARAIMVGGGEVFVVACGFPTRGPLAFKPREPKGMGQEELLGLPSDGERAVIARRLRELGGGLACSGVRVHEFVRVKGFSELATLSLFAALSGGTFRAFSGNEGLHERLCEVLLGQSGLRGGVRFSLSPGVHMARIFGSGTLQGRHVHVGAIDHHTTVAVELSVDAGRTIQPPGFRLQAHAMWTEGGKRWHRIMNATLPVGDTASGPDQFALGLVEVRQVVGKVIASGSVAGGRQLVGPKPGLSRRNEILDLAARRLFRGLSPEELLVELLMVRGMNLRDLLLYCAPRPLWVCPGLLLLHGYDEIAVCGEVPEGEERRLEEAKTSCYALGGRWVPDRPLTASHPFAETARLVWARR